MIWFLPIGRYIPDASSAIFNILKVMPLPPSKKSRYGDDDVELLKKVSDNLVTKETFIETLAKHVEQVCPLTVFSFCVKKKDMLEGVA
jgi:hypothetical protein